MWIKAAQREANIGIGKPIGVKTRFITLIPFVDENQILQVGGKISNAAIA